MRNYRIQIFSINRIKRYIKIVVISCFLFSCGTSNSQTEKNSSSKTEDTLTIPYATIVERIKAKQLDIQNNFKSENKEKYLNESSTFLYVSLVDSIFPSWYNTIWDFNGISNIPKEGKIACGYFVSTTLKHVGFNLDRYKLAQQAASVIITEVCGSNVKRYTSKESLIEFYKKGTDGLFIVGLDFHVGFLVVKNHEVYFVHSDYFKGKVVSEIALNSTGFSATKSYVIGEITNNSILMTSWINSTKIY